MTEQTYDTFISYSSKDLPLAQSLHRQLEKAGLRTWFDKIRLQPGFDWHKEIEHGCESSRILLPVLTPHWKESDWTKFETYGAEAVIPLHFDGDFQHVFTPPLTRFQGQTIDLTNPDEAAWTRLIDAIRSLLARPAPDKLERLAHLRYQANPYFVGREQELNQIHEELHQCPTAVLTQGQVRAIHALGGVGKTTLARQYVERFWRCYPQIFWLDCRLGIEAELARICDVLVPELRSLTNVPEKAQYALRALQSREERLMIIDNAEDEKSIQAYLSRTGHCRTLITSRFSGWSAAVRSIPLQVLKPDAAHKLLVVRAGRASFEDLSMEEQSACEHLAERLGYLPLALEQAAAYVEQEGAAFGFADYLQLYDAATTQLLAEGVLGSTEYPDSVMTTWRTTIAKLSAEARAILRLCSFLGSTPLPLSALLTGVDVIRAEAAVVADSPVAEPSHGETWVRQQVKQLRAYSMVDGDGQSITFHPLVQVVERFQLGETSGTEKATLERSLRWINNAFVGNTQDVRDWPVLEPLVDHVACACEHACRHDLTSAEHPTSRLLNDSGLLYLNKARHAEAEPLMERALHIDEQAYGPEHPNVATGLNNLAQLLEATNRLQEAEPLMERALRIDEQAYGPEHPNVAIRLNNLAQLLQDTNRLQEAEPLMERALRIDEQAYGPEHPDVARDLNNLAALLQATNRLQEAEPLYQKALSIFVSSLGAEHPSTITVGNNYRDLLEAMDLSPEEIDRRIRDAMGQ